MGSTPEQSDLTQKAERDDAARSHTADRMPTEEEAASAEQGRAQFAEDKERVAEHEKEMSELGAQVKGEGDIT
jgi:hypothetical protein